MRGTTDVSSHKERAATLIHMWCDEKGTECFAEQLVNLLDKEYLRLWPGLSHIAFPKKKDRLRGGCIPNKHWRFRFYSGCAAVLGWTDRVTYGDSRYYGQDLHEAIKLLWPDEDAVRPVKLSHRVRKLRNLKMAHTPTMTPMKHIASDDDVESEIETLLSVPFRVVGGQSPSVAPRKARIVSSSSRRQTKFLSPLKSPLRVTVYPSPNGSNSGWSSLCTQPEGSQFSLRRSKQQARKSSFRETVEFPEQAEIPANAESLAFEGDDPVLAEDVLPGRKPPPSLRHQQRWKVKPHVEGVRLSSSHHCVIDESALPVIRNSTSSFRAPHGYVTRNLFQENSTDHCSAETSNSNRGNSVNYVSSKNVGGAVGVHRIVGVEKEFFTDINLLGSECCDSEYICCELISESEADENNVSSLQVRLFHNGLTVDTFRSCCSFAEKFQNCTNHESYKSVLSGVQTEGVCSAAAQLLHPTVLSQPFSSESEDDWVEASDDSFSGSDSTSDWEEYAAEICEEDLPRLGIVKLDVDFEADPFEWRMADEFWRSHRVDYSHDTKFKGPHPEPVPEWFGEYIHCGEGARLQPIQIFNRVFPLDVMSRYTIPSMGRPGVTVACVANSQSSLAQNVTGVLCALGIVTCSTIGIRIAARRAEVDGRADGVVGTSELSWEAGSLCLESNAFLLVLLYVEHQLGSGNK
ncbi:hypothetical protein R1sor_010017 [Riccia sorocarpa]|uniref:Uncharacterized protein n=1 Tax=Riccia sorocarpa TaxID=122646 RepID=A0ABD3HY80_9MARC